MFRAVVSAGGAFGVGAESLETLLCDEREIPWPEIAFPSVECTLRRSFEDRTAGREGLHYRTFA